MNIQETTPRSEITIQGATFQAPEPFEAGHQLSDNEAAALNQLLHENLRNNYASTVKAALEEVSGKVDSLDLETLQKNFDEYAKNYEFGVRRSGPRVPKDPIAHQAWKIASGFIRKALAKKGIKLDSLPEGKFDELVEGLSKREDIVEAAKRAVEAVQSVQDISIDV